MLLNDGALMVIVGGVLSMVYVLPVNGSVVLMPGDKPVALARFNPIVPSPVPVFTVMVYVVPDPETEATLAPLTLPVVVKEKLLVLSPVNEAPNVAVYCIVDAFVRLEDTSVIELIVVGAGATVKVAEGPVAGAVFPALSEAVPAAMEIPRVPVPEILEMVTV